MSTIGIDEHGKVASKSLRLFLIWFTHRTFTRFRFISYILAALPALILTHPFQGGITSLLGHIINVLLYTRIFLTARFPRRSLKFDNCSCSSSSSSSDVFDHLTDFC